MTDKPAGKFFKAAFHFDWGQPAGHGSIPCFSVMEDGHFCGRAREWDGHRREVSHKFIPLHEAHDADVAEKVKKAVEAERGRCARIIDRMAELASFRDERFIHEAGAASIRASKEQV